MTNKHTLCPYHEDGLGWDACSDGFEGCEVEAARKAAAAPDRDALEAKRNELMREVLALDEQLRTSGELAYIEAARKQWFREGEIEIDHNAVVSVSDDGGAYVQAWVWVDDLNPASDDDERIGTCSKCGQYVYESDGDNAVDVTGRDENYQGCFDHKVCPTAEPCICGEPRPCPHVDGEGA